MAILTSVNRSQLAHRLDAEYFDPAFVKTEDRLANLDSVRVADLFEVSDGNHLTIAGSFSTSAGVRYLRGQDVSANMLIDDRNQVFIPEDLFGKLVRSHIFAGDILLTIVGANTGFVALAYDTPARLTASCKLAILRPKMARSSYTYAFLTSRYGQDQLRRAKRGGAQTGIILPDLRSVRITRLGTGIEETIGSEVAEAHGDILSARDLAEEAERTLLHAFGLYDYEPAEATAYAASFSQAISARRLDAEYFHPKFDDLVRRLLRYNGIKLRDLGVRSVELKTCDPDETYRYAEISDIDTTSGELSFTERIGRDLPANARMRLRGGELLVSKVRPTRGAVGIVPDDVGQDMVCSSAFAIYRVKRELREYLQLVLRTLIGRLQLERPSKGTSYPTVTAVDVDNVWIPFADSRTMDAVGEMVLQSHRLRQQGLGRLRDAAAAVEAHIEKRVPDAGLPDESCV